MEAFEDTIVARPALKRLNALLRDGIDAAPGDVRRALLRDNLSGGIDAARKRWSRRGAEDRIGAVTYATLLVVRELLDEAGGVLQRARKAHPDAVEFRIIEAERQLLAGEVEQARAALEQIDIEAIASPGVAAFLGDLMLDMGLDEPAVFAYERAVELGSEDVEISIRLGQMAMHDGEVRRAAEHFERGAEIAGDRVGLWEAAADALFRVDEDTRGLAAYEHVLRLEEADAEAWLEHGLALARIGEPAAAQEALERSVDLDPFDVDAWVTLGQVRMQMGRAEDALVAFENALEQREGDIDALLGVVSAALVIGDLQLAEDIARRAVDMVPDDPESHHSLGVTLQERGRHDEAIDAFEDALDLAESLQLPDTPYRASLALGTLAKGDVDEALAQIDQVLDPQTLDEGLVAEFAEALIRAGAFDEARQFMEAHEGQSQLLELVFPVFAFVMTAYRGDEATPSARAALQAARANSAALPVDWDFSQLERLGLRMDRVDKRRLSDLVALMEGRIEPDEVSVD